MLCSYRVTEGSAQGCFPTGPHAWDPPGAGLGWGIAPSREQGSSPLCPFIALGGHEEANIMSRPVQHVETINNLT